jgi:hypothetical protein
VQESDAFDDDEDHWGLVEPKDDPVGPTYDRLSWFFSRLLLLLVLVLFVVWTGVLTYG